MELMADSKPNILLFSGSSHPALAKEIAGHLGIELAKAELGRFPDNETSFQIRESVRGRDVFVVQTIARDPNYYLMELLIMIDAFKRASARSISVVIPYYGYCRQDRRDKPRVPITAKLVANQLENAGASRVLTMDLHADQLQGFFDIPVDNLFGQSNLVAALKKGLGEDLVVVTPDIGSIKLASNFAHDLRTEFAIIYKRRVTATQVDAVTVIGDVKGKNVLLADDMCTTAGTLLSAANACQEKGAEKIYAVVTHGLFVGEAVEKISKSPISKLYYSNTIQPIEKVQKNEIFVEVSVSSLFAHAIRCIVSAGSISAIYDGKVICNGSID